MTLKKKNFDAITLNDVRSLRKNVEVLSKISSNIYEINVQKHY